MLLILLWCYFNAPFFVQEITAPIISLLMAYIFNAMSHLAVDVRLMAFKFFELVVLNYPSSFMLYAEKVSTHSDLSLTYFSFFLCVNIYDEIHFFHGFLAKDFIVGYMY